MIVPTRDIDFELFRTLVNRRPNRASAMLGR